MSENLSKGKPPQRGRGVPGAAPPPKYRLKGKVGILIQAKQNHWSGYEFTSRLTESVVKPSTYSVHRPNCLTPPAPPLGGHTTFRILSLLRYVVDIGKSSPNPKFFWNPMKTDKREAYQSSKIGLFSCFWTTPWKIAKNHYLNDKCRFFLLLKRNNNFWNNKI